jgi:hypothetical protein
MAPVTVSRLASAWLPVVAWAALIFTLSSIPDLGTGLGGWDLALRKAAHVAEYGVLGALLFRALSLAGQPFHAASTVAWAWLIGTVYAASDELHQHFVAGRQAAPLDLVFDAVGVAVGALAVRLARSSRLLRGASAGRCRPSTGKSERGHGRSPRPLQAAAQAQPQPATEDGAAESAP